MSNADDDRTPGGSPWPHRHRDRSDKITRCAIEKTSAVFAPAGEDVLARARRVLAEIDAMAQDLDSQRAVQLGFAWLLPEAWFCTMRNPITDPPEGITVAVIGRERRVLAVSECWDRCCSREICAQRIQHPRVRYIELCDSPDSAIQLAWRATRPPARVVRRFIDAAVSGNSVVR